MKFRCLLLLIAMLACLPVAKAQAPEWPGKPVRIVVAFPPGGFTDVLARLFAPALSETIGQPFFVENRAGGAGGMVGTEHVANSKPDGYTTILLPASFAATPALYSLASDSIRGIAPIAMIAAGAYVLAVHPSVQAANLSELIALARARPGTLNFGSSGTGTDLHLALEHFRQLTGTEMVHVPYKGIALAINDLLGGSLQLMLSTPLALAPHIKSGKLRAIAVTTEKRLGTMPDVPAIGELVPGYAARVWFGIGAPAGTPREIVARLNQAVANILKRPDVLERLRAGGVEAAHSTPEEFSRIIAQDFALWSRVIKAGNIKVD